MNKTVEAKNIGHSFGTRQVLRDVSVTLEKGEIFGLLGPSGAGKTTLIKILTGQLAPSSGESSVLGIRSGDLRDEDYRQIGIMMEQFGLYDRLSCFDNLSLIARIYGIPQETILPALGKLGLAGAKRTLAANLSKGMRSRLQLARVLMASPMLLILDEPTAGLDPSTSDEIHKLILEEKSRGVTVFLTTHNMSEAEKLCDRVALLNEGDIAEYGAPKDLCRKYNRERRLKIHLYSGEERVLPQDASAAGEIRRLLESGELETIHSTEPNLENVFMELTGRRLDI